MVGDDIGVLLFERSRAAAVQRLAHGDPIVSFGRRRNIIRTA